MESLYRWVASHHNQVYRTLYTILLLFFMALVILTELPSLIIAAFAVICLYLLKWGIFQCSANLLNQSHQIMVTQCDPLPFLREMQLQVSYPTPTWSRTINRINLAVALRHSGDCQAALDELRKIRIEDKNAAVLPIRALYYSNLADILQLLHDDAGAEDARQRFFALADGNGRNAVVKEFPNAIPLNEAERLYHQGDYAAALAKAGTVQPRTPMEQVEAAFFRAKCAAAIGDTDAAKQELGYVLAHGNKLAVTQWAETMLNELK